MASLPWEIIVEILCRLPVQDLLRYRTVCKAWCSLIGGSDFIKLHLKHSTENRSNLGLVLRGKKELLWLDLDSLDSPLRLNYPIDDGDNIVQVLGSCDGLLAVMNRHGDLALWNPSTRRYKPFPISEINRPLARRDCPIYTVGLGYDPVSNDHKLFRMMNFEEKDDIPFRFDPDVEIYCVKTYTWKRINNFPNDLILFGQKGILVCNALHWPSLRLTNLDLTLCQILAFDLVTETCCELALPELDDDNGFWKGRLVELGGCLCMVYNHSEGGKNSDHVDVWVMKDYRVKESWTKLFTVEPTDAIGSFTGVVPIAYLKGDDRVLLVLDGEKFIVYDLLSMRAENVRTIDVPGMFDTRICVQSLVGVGTTDGKAQGSRVGRIGIREMSQTATERDETMDGFQFKGLV